MSDTPRTEATYAKSAHWTNEDGAIEACAAMRDFARELERENATLREQLAKSEARWLSLARGVKQL